MSLAIRAVYEHGQLRLLDPVSLTEGQEIQLVILSEREQARAILGDLLVEMPEFKEEDIDEVKLLKEIADDFRGSSLSDAIIQERNESP